MVRHTIEGLPEPKYGLSDLLVLCQRIFLPKKVRTRSAESCVQLCKRGIDCNWSSKWEWACWWWDGKALSQIGRPQFSIGTNNKQLFGFIQSALGDSCHLFQEPSHTIMLRHMYLCGIPLGSPGFNNGYNWKSLIANILFDCIYMIWLQIFDWGWGVNWDTVRIFLEGFIKLGVKGELLAALAALYLNLVTGWVSATLEFWHKEWLLRLETKRQKNKKTKRQKTKTKKRVQYCDVRAVSHSCDVFR